MYISIPTDRCGGPPKKLPSREKSLRVMMSQAVRPAEPPGSELPVWGVELTNAQESPPAPPPLVEGWTGASLPWELGG